ncbi:biliverdin-producing heme oxygenase [Lacipirellula sp.]|uniref:biliverdin-producing heme oxygenase n=1 Tax=Lacipirellula sp. TaxID=2691419 RepID=UPI003D1407AE
MHLAPLRTRLKESTHDAHTALERALDLLNPALRLPDYCSLLARFYAYYLPLEASLQRTADRRLVAGRWKCAALADDLRSLGMSATELRSIAPAAAPPLRSVADAVGAMYVVEGSTLGGMILARHFSARFGLTSRCGLAFFTCYGERTGEMWQRYLASLAAFDNPRDADRVVAAAVSTFESLAAWLTQPAEPLVGATHNINESERLAAR